MEFDEQSQNQANSIKLTQLKVLTVSLLEELQKAQSSNPQYIIINETIIGIESELNKVLQQNDYLSIDNKNLQFVYENLQYLIKDKIPSYLSSMEQSYSNFSEKSQLIIMNLCERVEKLQSSLQDKRNK